MFTLPAKVRRKKHAFISIRSQLARRNLLRQSLLFYSELRDFIATRAIDDAGPGFMRYLSIGRDGELDIEFGYMTGRLHPCGGPVRSGMLPSGTFVSAEWTGAYEKLPEVNAMLPGWARHSGVDLDITETDDATYYGCRAEIYHMTPLRTQDPSQYRTEIILLTRPSSDSSAAEREA